MPESLDKSQGEPEYVLDFWGRAQAGLADEVDETVYRFVVTKEDSEKYPDLQPGMRLLVAKSTDGFVFHEVLAPKLTN